MTFYIPDVQTKECPVSLITPESFQLVQEISAAEWVHGGTGAWPGGLDSSAWDCRWFDVVHLIQRESAAIEEERAKTEASF